jgi:TPR repeat protein
LYERASARGVPIADCALGNQYLRGLGMPKDPAKAVSLCRKSADRGVADAQADLGQLYLTGEGVEKNLPAMAFHAITCKPQRSGTYQPSTAIHRHQRA